MVDPNALHELLLSRLRALPDVGERVYDSYVPEVLPEDERGFVRPYILVFPNLGADLPGERDLSLLDDTEVLDWSPQTNCVASGPSQVMAVAQQVRAALTNLSVAGGWLKTDPDAFRVSTPIPDTTVTPVRLYLPLRWRLITT